VIPIASYRTRHHRDDALPTHRHQGAYAALVIDGSYVETSVDGPFLCTPGTLVVHPGFHAHGNRFGRRGARVLNAELPSLTPSARLRVVRVASMAEAVGVMQRTPERLDDLIALATGEASLMLPHWQAEFIDALEASDKSISGICRELGVSLAHASRAILKSHGLPPQLLRRELRWRRALALLADNAPLAEVACVCGFADQSHFSRVTRGIAGMPPAALRRWIKSVQDGPRSGGL
jgi:AraC family transcriptional regulator